MTWTKKNLREVKDDAVDFGISEVQEARFPRKDIEAETTAFAHHRVKPGRRQAFAHRHEAAEEVHVVLSGTGSVRLDDEVVELVPLDLLRIAPGVTRVFEAGPDGLEYLVFGPRHEKDGEVVPLD